MRTTVLTVFCCGASRNKRGRRAFAGTDRGLRTRAWAHFSIQILRITRPAPGFRERANGGLNNVGNNGFSYSSSVSGSNGVYLNFNVTNLNPSNANSRAYGLQLRCLSDAQRLLARK